MVFSFRCLLYCVLPFFRRPQLVFLDSRIAQRDPGKILDLIVVPTFWILYRYYLYFFKHTDLQLRTFVMACCINCNIAVHAHFQHYIVTDLSVEIVALIEEWITREVSNEDLLCQECFELVAMEHANRLANVHFRGPRQVGHQSVCVWCGVSLLQRRGRRSRPLPEGRAERNYISNMIHPRQVPTHDARVCNACWQRANNAVRHEIIENVQDVDIQPAHIEAEHDNIEVIHLQNYARTPNTSTHCFVPECSNLDLHQVPQYLKKRVLSECKLFITPRARVCEEHIVLYDWDILDNFEFMSQFDSQQIEQMLNLLKDSSGSTLNFEDIENMNNNICRYWTGLNVFNFMAIFSVIQVPLSEVCRKPKTALAMYLIKLRTSDPLVRIASLFVMSKSTVIKYIRSARSILKEFYVPLHLGVPHLTRENLSSRNLVIPQGLFGTNENSPIVICDGTYIYLQKSSNYLFQKKTYSLHKYRNLLKPFVMVAPDGHIIDIFGPYPATMSDADIVKKLFQNENSPLRAFFRAGDVFILDRGFRDAIGLLLSLGYLVHKPETLDVGESQLSTEKANKSRKVTMCRWVVEFINGRFKRDYKIFRTESFNSLTKYIMDDFKIAGAIINQFHPVITDRSDAQLLLSRALSRYNVPNHLAEYVIEHQLNRHRANFVTINGQVPALDVFPIMEMSDLILFSLGTYQIKQARSYYGEHIRENGTFAVEISDNLETVNVPGISLREAVLIRGRIRSRHQTNKIYFTYIIVNPLGENWEDRISGYYCSCIVGKRTMGTCAHVMTIVWYLGWARYQQNINPPASFHDNVLVREDVEYVEE